MTVHTLLAAVDAEIANWEKARKAIESIFAVTPKAKHTAPKKRTRHMSKAGRAAIAKAQKARWAKVRAKAKK